MSIHRRFPSLAYSKEHGYAYDSGAFDARSSGAVNQYFRMFKTYGDGLCQHSGDWAVTHEYLADYLVSLAVAMQSDEELLDSSKYELSRRPSVKQIEFAASVIYNPDGNKRRYFSAKEMKVSSSPAKQYDKRYQEITDVHDGNANSIFRILIEDYADGIERYSYASAIREWLMNHNGYMELPGTFLKWSKDHEEARMLNDAYESCWALIQAFQFRHVAEVGIGNYRRKLPQATNEAA